MWKKGLRDKDVSFDAFSKKLLGGIPESTALEYEIREDYAQAIKLLNKILHAQKMNNLYNILYEKASDGDIQSIKAFTDFSKIYFEDKTDEFLALMNGIQIETEDDE